MIKVLIAEDQRLIGEGIKFIIEKSCEIEVVGIAKNGFEALELCKRFLPDVVLMDLKMPVCDGIEATKLIKFFMVKIKILILTTFDDEESVSEALKNGADGYLLKDISSEQLIATIKNVVIGLIIIDEKVYHNIVKKFDSNLRKDEVHHLLTKREKAVISLVIYSKTNKEIAFELEITEGRVKNIITSILKKLELVDRTALAVYAIKNKIY